jgi:ABC-type iron transport system FetAB permease component
MSPYVRGALRAGMIPPVDNLRSLGIVWIKLQEFCKMF